MAINISQASTFLKVHFIIIILVGVKIYNSGFTNEVTNFEALVL